jgi:PAS domain S-box-containing protein
MGVAVRFSYVYLHAQLRNQRRRVCGLDRNARFIQPPRLRFRKPRALGFLCAFLLVLPCVEAEPRPSRRVLILNEAGPSNPASSIIEQGIRTGLQNAPYRLEFYREYLETILFPDAADQLRFRDFYIRKYRNRQPDVIITAGPSPLRFMAEVHKKFFPGVSIVYCLPNGGVPGAPTLDSDFTGVENDMAPAETVRVAQRLLPDTKHLFVVGGTSPVDRRQEEIVREQLNNYDGHVEISYLTDLSMPDLLERLRHLPNQSVVLFVALGQDATGTRFISGAESGPMVAAASSAPVFGLFDIYLNHGEVGGYLSSVSEQGKIAGAMALRILQGEKPQDIPAAKAVISYMFDWRALKRWKIKESALPPGGIVLNRQPTVWESYKWYIIAGVSLIILEGLLISALLWQRARRKKTETELANAYAGLQESEHRFRLVANTAPVMIWMSGPNKSFYYFNQPWLDFCGRPLVEETGNAWWKNIHPEDLTGYRNLFHRSFSRHEAFTIQYRLRRYDGEYRWILDMGVPRSNSDGSFAGYIGSCIDITERKLAEEALSNVSRRLIEAQEQERTRIARELHDDINQRIAMLGIEAGVLEQNPPDSVVELQSRLSQFRSRLSETGSEIQAMSHRLHSSKLEILGLVAACRGFCKEIADHNKVTVDFTAEDISPDLPRDVSLCIFRVLQESLNNAVKHSGGQHFEAGLRGIPGEMHLKVRDYGVGFDADAAMQSQGLGLISMRERVGLMNGTMSITSQPMAGTEIKVRVPVFGASDKTRAISGAA